MRELSSGSNVAVSVAGFPNGPAIRLRIPELDPSASYVLTVNRGEGPLGNVMAPDSQVPLLFATNTFLLRWTRCGDGRKTAFLCRPEWRTNHLAPYLYGEAPGVFYTPAGRWITVAAREHVHRARSDNLLFQHVLRGAAPCSRQFTLTHLVDEARILSEWNGVPPLQHAAGPIGYAPMR